MRLETVLSMADALGPGDVIELTRVISEFSLSSTGYHGPSGAVAFERAQAERLYERAKVDPHVSGECQAFCHGFAERHQAWAGEYLSGVLNG